MKKKFKKYSFWTSLAGAVVVLVEVIGKIVGFIPNDQLITDIIMAVAGVLVVLGVVSAPNEEEIEEQNNEEKENKVQDKENEIDKK